MVSQYSDLGIDIFDSNHSFFNDLCYSYDNTESDLILKDRVIDIFQNYSLCDNGCDYDQIDIDSMTVICSCQVKNEINVEIEEPVFGTIIEDAFKDSNFGVLLCYNLVFSLDYKTKNIGFWISLSFTIINPPESCVHLITNWLGNWLKSMSSNLLYIPIVGIIYSFPIILEKYCNLV